MILNDSTALHIRLKKQFLEDYIRKEIQESLKESIDYNGFEINIQLEDDLALKLDTQKTLSRLPLFIKLEKPEGLFTVEIDARILVDVQTKFNIDQDFTLTTQTEIIDHEWVKEPEAKLGVFNFSVVSLANFVLDRLKEKFTNSFDESVNNKFSLPQLIANQFNYYKEFDIPNTLLMVKPCPNSIQLLEITDHQDVLECRGYLNGHPIITSKEFKPEDNNTITFQKLSEVESNFQVIRGAFSYNDLTSIILPHIKTLEIAGKEIEIDSLQIEYNDKLNIDLNLVNPFAALIKVNLSLDYNPDRGLELKDAHIDVQAKNIFHKLGAPVISKVIESRLEDYFPFDIQTSLQKFYASAKSNIPQNDKVSLNVKEGQVKLTNVDFKKEGIFVRLKIDQLSVHVAQK